MWDKNELDCHLVAVEACIPHLRSDMDTLSRIFDDEVEVILRNAAEADKDYAMEQLERMIERAGVNAKPLGR